LWLKALARRRYLDGANIHELGGMLICPGCQAGNDGRATFCQECGTPLVAIEPGTVLNDRYEVLAALGRGGMGMVYKVHDRELDEALALKVLRADLAGNPMAESRFRSEIKLARKVSHPGVCRIFEYGRHEHLSYIVMELVEGVDLKSILRDKGTLPTREALEVAIAIGQALRAIHEVGIVHRDLKASNVMLAAGNRVKLMDFGIAKSTQADGTRATAPGQIIGTPEYMSPEQARGQEIDARSDVYALGVVTYELLTGGVPLSGTTAIETLFKQMNEPPPFETARQKGVPERVLPVLRKALAKKREDRFAAAQELVTALEEAKAALAHPAGLTVRLATPTAAEVPTAPAGGPSAPTVAVGTPPPRTAAPPSPPGPRPRRRGPAVAATLAVAGVLAVVFAFVGGRALRDRIQPSPKQEAKPLAEEPSTWRELRAMTEGAGYDVQVQARQAVYRSGDGLVIDVTTPRDGYLNVLNVGENENAALVLFPNQYHPDNAVKAGTTITIPDEGSPFSLPATLSEGSEEERTLILVIHTTAPLNAYETGSGDGFLRQLSSGATRSFRVAKRREFGVGKTVVTITR
jgi:predicted Ser/Thr protein kinase